MAAQALRGVVATRSPLLPPERRVRQRLLHRQLRRAEEGAASDGFVALAPTTNRAVPPKSLQVVISRHEIGLKRYANSGIPYLTHTETADTIRALNRPHP